MDRKTPWAWLVWPDGCRLAIGEQCARLGRSPDNDVVLGDSRASNRQALIYAGSDGPVLVPLGRNPTLINGAAVERAAALSDGDVVSLPGLDLTLALRRARPAVPWFVEIGGGALVHPTSPAWRLGGGDDDVYVPGWPAGAIEVEVVQGALLAVFHAEARVAGAPVEIGEMVSLDSGEVVTLGGRDVRFVSGAPLGDDTTAIDGGSGFPVEVRFRFHANGGALHVRFDDADVVVEVSELRCRLVAGLLGAGGGGAPGDLVPDDDLLRMIWPNQIERTRTSLNQLLHRLRADLARAGINPFRVLERPRGRDATRFRLGPDTLVTVE